MSQYSSFKDYQLLMEGWRAYAQEESNTIFLFEGGKPQPRDFELILERRALKEAIQMWEASSLYECDKLLLEVDSAAFVKEFFSDIGKKVNDFILKLSVQAFNLLQRGSESVKMVLSVIKKLVNAIEGHCTKLPTTCKIARTSAMILSIFALGTLFYSPRAYAAIQYGDAPLSDEEYSYIRGVIMDGFVSGSYEGLSPESQRNIAETIEQLDKLQASPDVTGYENLSGTLQAALDSSYGIMDYYERELSLGRMTPEKFHAIKEYFEKMGQAAKISYDTIVPNTDIAVAGDIPEKPSW
tara:strand:+ start:4839 stop:5729 length:891 start_codon:yes stop_codon:yes gene_type:complete